MENKKTNNIATVFMITASLLLSTGLACADNRAMTPEVAAKRENFRKQNEQRVTDKQRKSAAEALKAKRLKVFEAQQLANKPTEHKNVTK